MQSMESCQVCSRELDSSRAINCSGVCGRIFHFTCIGMSKSQFSSWSSKIGLLWFCDSCRLNFEPAVYDREKTIMKALRELLIRTDSMDTRLGNYGDNLRRINKTIFGSQQQTKSANNSLQHTTFLQSIDELNLDDAVDDPINRSRSCDDTSFFEVLDEVNSSIAHPQDKFVVGANKRVHILPYQHNNIGNSNNASRMNVSTPAATKQFGTKTTSAPTQVMDISANRSEPTHVDELRDPRHGATRPNSLSLRVASKNPAPNDSESFYVTPFAPDQNEEEVKQYVIDISNANSSSVNVTKLVPRGKNVEDLSFVSFKVTVPRNNCNTVGDSWYWPDGIAVRVFEPTSKNGSATRLPITQ